MKKAIIISKKKARVSDVLFQLPAKSFPVHHWEPVVHRNPIAFIISGSIFAGNMGCADETGGGSFASNHVGRHFLFEGFDEGLGGVVLQEQVEAGLVLVNKAAESGDVNVSEVGVHDVVNGQIEQFFQQSTVVEFFLYLCVVPSQVPKQNNHFIEEGFGVRVIAVLLHLPLAVSDHYATTANESIYQTIVLGVSHRLQKRSKSTFTTTVQNLSCQHQTALSYSRITFRRQLSGNRAFGFSQLMEQPHHKGNHKLDLLGQLS